MQFFQKMLNWYYKILNLDCHAILTIFLHHNFFFLHIKNYARYKTFGKTFWGLSIPSHCSQWLKPPWNVEPNHWEQYWVTFDLVPLKMETPSTPIDIANWYFCETSFLHWSLHKDLSKIINTWPNHHVFKT